MKATLIIVCLCVALITSIVHGKDLPEGAKIVNQMAEKNLNISGIFQPMIGGYLGEGFFGFTFKGIMLYPNPRQVAMKFTPKKFSAEAADEYEIYTYLYAINNETVEQYGIPCVFFYGSWKDYMLLATTLLDSTIYRSSESDGSIKAFDILIMCQEFVRISKYMHYCGIRHNDIKVDNIMFRKHQGFIIDFNMAGEIFDSDDINERRVAKSRAKRDWLCFLFAMLKLVGFDYGTPETESSGSIIHADILRQDVVHTIEQIGEIGHNGVKRVFLEFAKHALQEEIEALRLPNMSVNNNGTPFYDQVYQVIQEVMRGRPPFVSWLTDEEKLNAANYQVVPISSINDRFVNPTASYPAVDPNFFYRMYHQ